MRILIATAVIFMSSIAFAQNSSRSPYKTGNDYLTICDPIYDKTQLSTSELADYAICTGYLRGLHDGITEVSTTSICNPDTVTYEQLGRVFLKYLRDNPDKLHLKVSTLYLRAMATPYPCK